MIPRSIGWNTSVFYLLTHSFPLTRLPYQESCQIFQIKSAINMPGLKKVLFCIRNIDIRFPVFEPLSKFHFCNWVYQNVPMINASIRTSCWSNYSFGIASFESSLVHVQTHNEIEVYIIKKFFDHAGFKISKLLFRDGGKRLFKPGVKNIRQRRIWSTQQEWLPGLNVFRWKIRMRLRGIFVLGTFAMLLMDFFNI